MSTENEKCVVCKCPVPSTGFVTESGRVCSTICADYIAEKTKNGEINESDDLNEVQMLLQENLMIGYGEGITDRDERPDLLESDEHPDFQGINTSVPERGLIKECWMIGVLFCAVRWSLPSAG